MIKQTLMFTKPASLSLKDRQLVIDVRDADQIVTRPIEDIGFVVVENQMVRMTVPLLNALADNNVSVMFCDNKEMPRSMLMSLEGNTTLQESYRYQICASYESQKVHIKRVKSFITDTGMISILSVTDKQYGDIINFWGKEKKKKKVAGPLQLELF